MSTQHFFKQHMKGLVPVVSLTLTLLTTSCPTELSKVTESNLYLKPSYVSNTDIPYTSEKALNAIVQDEEVLDYRIARKTAIIELETSYREMLHWPKDVRLSRLPVVLYDTHSSPVLYEFMVLEATAVIGTVTTYAHTKYPEIICNVLPYVRNYAVYRMKYNNCSDVESKDFSCMCTLEKKYSEEQLMPYLRERKVFNKKK